MQDCGGETDSGDEAIESIQSSAERPVVLPFHCTCRNWHPIMSHKARQRWWISCKLFMSKLWIITIPPTTYYCWIQSHPTRDFCVHSIGKLTVTLLVARNKSKAGNQKSINWLRLSLWSLDFYHLYSKSRNPPELATIRGPTRISFSVQSQKVTSGEQLLPNLCARLMICDHMLILFVRTIMARDPYAIAVS